MAYGKQHHIISKRLPGGGLSDPQLELYVIFIKKGKKNPSVFAPFVRTGRRFAYNTFKVYTDAYTQLINLNYGGGEILPSSILSALHIQIYCMRNIMQRAKEY